jgi:hypothetical protein
MWHISLLHLSEKAFVSLQAPPTKAAAVSLVHERNNGVAGVPVDKGQEKPLVDLSVLSPVGSGLSEKYKEERQEQQDREETEREMKREQRSKDRERTDLSKPPPQRASKGVKPESRLPKSEKACELLQTQTGYSFLVWFEV